MSLGTTNPIRFSVRRVALIVVAVVVGAFLITFINFNSANTIDPKTKAVEAIGLERIVGVNDEEFVSMSDAGCIVPVSYIADDKTGSLIILAQNGNQMMQIRSAEDMKLLCM